MHKKLFIPGPVEVREEVLQKMATPMIGHRTKDASALQRGISDKLRKVFHTEEEILLSTSSGSGLMEGAIRSCTAKRAAVFSIGAFGKRWYEMAKFNNIPADLFEVESGKATPPESVDEALATGKYDLVTITHNETATGVMNPLDDLSKVIKKYPDVVWCVDTVSSMAGTLIEVDKLGIDICITISYMVYSVCLLGRNGFFMFFNFAIYIVINGSTGNYSCLCSSLHYLSVNIQLWFVLLEKHSIRNEFI